MEQILLLFFHVIISALVALLGRNRKIGYAWSFVLCLVLSPVIGVIIILFSKKNDEVDFAEIPKGIQQNQKPIKITGIIILVIGVLSTPGGIIQTINGCSNFAGLIWVVLGAFLLRRVNKKKEEDKKKVGTRETGGITRKPVHNISSRHNYGSGVFRRATFFSCCFSA